MKARRTSSRDPCNLLVDFDMCVSIHTVNFIYLVSIFVNDGSHKRHKPVQGVV